MPSPSYCQDIAPYAEPVQAAAVSDMKLLNKGGVRGGAIAFILALR